MLNDDGAYEEQADMHKELFDKAWGSRDVIEAQVARIEKRPARFQGHSGRSPGSFGAVAQRKSGGAAGGRLRFARCRRLGAAGAA